MVPVDGSTCHLALPCSTAHPVRAIDTLTPVDTFGTESMEGVDKAEVII